MKLKELLKKQNIKWPEGATHAVQDYDGCVKFASSNNLDLINGVRNRKSHALMGSIAGLQWNTAIIPHSSIETTNEAHPHAELMLQYAQDAMTTTEPWKLWQFRSNLDNWEPLIRNPLWGHSTSYRRRPITKLIHGVEVPDISFIPEQDKEYYFPAPHITKLYGCTNYLSKSENDSFKVQQGLCYPHTEEGKQAAILHAKAMLGIK